jgi:hypothetical protein
MQAPSPLNTNLVLMKKILMLLLSFYLVSCHKREEKTSIKTYFDMEEYFAKQVDRLNGTQPTIAKKVSVKNGSEEKSLKVTDWKTELSSFANADINKAAWRGLFSKSINKNTTTYISNDKKIPIKKLIIVQENNKVLAIKIYKSSDNYLYSSTDTLCYYPDSLYLIKSYQKVRLLKAKEYQVIGKFLK